MTTIADTLTAYHIAARAEGLSPGSIRAMDQAVRYFNDFHGGIKDVGDVTANNLRAFINALRQKRRWSNHPENRSDRPLSPFTIRSYTRSVKVYWNWLLKEGYLAINPMLKVKLPKVPDTVMETLSEEEISAILDQTDQSSVAGFRDRTLFLLLLDTGARISEITNLKTENVDLEQFQLKVIGKGNRQRILPIGRNVTRLLTEWQKKYRPDNPAGYFFTTVKGKQMTPDRVRHLLAIYSIKAQYVPP